MYVLWMECAFTRVIYRMVLKSCPERVLKIVRKQASKTCNNIYAADMSKQTYEQNATYAGNISTNVVIESLNEE